MLSRICDYHPPSSPLRGIPVFLDILDTRTRKSWAFARISIPMLGIEIEDWFHLCTFNQDTIRTGYGFTPKSMGTASHQQLVAMLKLVSDLVVEAYFYRENGTTIDRFGELDTTDFRLF
jgi:hypothetical protein